VNGLKQLRSRDQVSQLRGRDLDTGQPRA